MKPLATVLLAAALVPVAAQGGTICRWTDASGRTQLAETVPEPYRAKAICTDTAQYELTPAQRAEAEERAARARRAAASAAVGPAPVPSVTRAAPAREKPRLDDSTDCETWRRVYKQSEACFAPFRTTKDAVKAEAFQKCEVVPAPPLRCGPEVR